LGEENREKITREDGYIVKNGIGVGRGKQRENNKRGWVYCKGWHRSWARETERQ